MEVSKSASSGIKIKSKNTSFAIDPSGNKTEEDVVVLFDKPKDYSQFSDKLVIDSPGEYEIGGVSIKVGRFGESEAFEFLEDGQKLIIFSSPDITGDVETEDSKVVLVHLSKKLSDEALSAIRSEVVSFYGPEEFLPQSKETLKKIDKINLKKTETLKGYLVHLAK